MLQSDGSHIASSLKQGLLPSAIHWFFKIAQADTHEAKTLFRA